MQVKAGLGEILLAHETYALVKDEILAKEMEPVVVKGFARPVRSYRVVGIYEDLAAEGRVIHHDSQGLKAFVDLDKLTSRERTDAIKLFEDILSKLQRSRS